MKGNQGWSTRPRDGSPAGRPPLGVNRRNQTYRATPQEHEVVKYFVKYHIRKDLKAAAALVGYPLEEIDKHDKSY